MHTVSVIVPNFNHARYLRQRLDSIYNQTFEDFEVILLDDASKDESIEIMQEYAQRPNTRLVLNRENSGSTFKQWNKGVSLATGKYVWIAESDDWAEKSFLAKTVAVLDAHPTVGLVHSDSWIVDQAGNKLERRCDFLEMKLNEALPDKDSVANGQQEVCNRIVRWNTISNASAVVFRKDLYLDVGGAAETMSLAGDWYLWIKMLEVSDYAYLAEPLNYNRTHFHTVREQVGAKLSVLGEKIRVLAYVLEHFPVNGVVAGGVLRSFLGPQEIAYYQSSMVRSLDMTELLQYINPLDVATHMGIRWQMGCLLKQIKRRMFSRRK